MYTLPDLKWIPDGIDETNSIQNDANMFDVIIRRPDGTFTDLPARIKKKQLKHEKFKNKKKELT